jgi:hypothetical protein
MATQQTVLELGLADDLGFEIEVEPLVEPLLSAPMLEILHGALRIFHERASEHGVSNGTMTITEFTSAEEGDQHVILTHWADTTPRVASAYWDDVATDVHCWIRDLPADLQTLARDQLMVAVRWNGR